MKKSKRKQKTKGKQRVRNTKKNIGGGPTDDTVYIKLQQKYGEDINYLVEKLKNVKKKESDASAIKQFKTHGILPTPPSKEVTPLSLILPKVPFDYFTNHLNENEKTNIATQIINDHERIQNCKTFECIQTIWNENKDLPTNTEKYQAIATKFHQIRKEKLKQRFCKLTPNQLMTEISNNEKQLEELKETLILQNECIDKMIPPAPSGSLKVN